MTFCVLYSDPEPAFQPTKKALVRYIYVIL